MKWKWIRGPSPEPDPFWLDPLTGSSRSDLLLGLLADVGNPGWRKLAAERLRVEVGGIAPAEWPRLDELLRQRMRGFGGFNAPRWVQGPDDVRRVALPAGTEAAVLTVLAAHPSGYVREAAVRRLSLPADGDELPALLLRGGDWVDQVRTRSLDALHARVAPDYGERWVEALPLVLRLRAAGHGDADRLADAVLALLRSEAREAVWMGLDSPDRTVRRTCFRILREHGRPALAPLVRIALRSADPLLRLLAAQSAAELDDSSLYDILPRMMADRFPRVRMVALRLGAERMGTAALPALRRALLDRSPAIRADARRALERLAPMDFAGFYRRAVSAEGPRLPAAVAGLAETGTEEDAEHLATLADHPRPRVRTAALRALERLTGDRAVPALVRGLGDSNPVVSRVAVDTLRGRAARLEVTAIASWFSGRHPPHVRRNALSLLAARGKWDAIAWILGAIADLDPEVRAAGMTHFRRWRQRFNRSALQPTLAQRERVQAALEESTLRLSPPDVQWLRFAAEIPPRTLIR